MARCSYCGQPAGFLRRQHPECSQRHQRAISLIPGFFAKVTNSPVSVERFGDLLRRVAEASYLRPDELKSLCIIGLKDSMDSVLRERPPTIAEVQRIAELAGTLEADFSAGFGLDEKLAKMSIVSELYDGRIPDIISVVGPMPIEFGRGEAILWIFNHVTAYRMSIDNEAEGGSIDMAGPIDARYFDLKTLGENHSPAERPSDELKGDLVLTNRTIRFLLNENSQIRIPIARITSLQAHAEGIQVARKPARPWTFLLDDPWFAANAIARLIQLVHRRA